LGGDFHQVADAACFRGGRMSNNITPSKEAAVPPQQASSLKEKKSSICPYCDSEIDHLMMQTIDFHEFRLKNDKPEVLPAPNEQINIFYCPVCGEEVATSQEDAIEFLKGKRYAEDTSLTDFVNNGVVASEDNKALNGAKPEDVQKREHVEEKKSDLDAFINELKDFKLEERIAKPKVSLLDPAQLSNIEDYRTKFIPSTIGLVTQYDIFDNHIIVVDEGSRNPRGLETLLTRMSISAINESVRIIIITDNLEPFTEVMSNPRYAPLHDRTFKTFTSTIKNELSILQHFNEKPSIKFNQTDLLIIKNFIDNIPVPEHILFLAKTIGYMLGYKFSIGIINETKYLQLFNREENPPVTIDVFKDIEFKFIPGGRFVHHTLSLAKFIAFLKGHDYVTIEDFKQAVATTIMSRTIIETKNYTEYKLSFIEIFNKIRELLKDNSIVEEVATLATALQNNDPQLENMFKTIMSKLPDKPFLAPAIASILEIQLTKGINIRKLPKNIQYSIEEIMLQKGDLSTLEMHSSSEAIEQRKNIIKGE
jgi:hypothetical protein